MDVEKLPQDQRNQGVLIDECIAAFQRVVSGRARKGRPAAWMNSGNAPVKAKEL